MQKALTNKSMEALKPQAKRYEVHDLYCPGMSVRVSTQGTKVFTVKFRYGIALLSRCVHPHGTIRQEQWELRRKSGTGEQLCLMRFTMCHEVVGVGR